MTVLDSVFGWTARLAGRRLDKIIAALLAKRAAQLPADEALRFLLGLDNVLYALSGRYAVAYGAGNHVKQRVTRYFDFFLARCHPDERVFDVGCGSGALAHALAERGCRLVAIDFSSAKIDHARAHHAHPRIQWLVGDATTAEIGSCDVVVLSNVLEHVAERVDLLSRLIARSGARRFLIRVPLVERDWRVPIKRELGIEWRLDLTHHTEYTLESFGEEMAAANLAITHLEVRWGEIWAEVEPQPVSERSR
ncbi:MAG: class I SAM-dependent methyltransferase [Magnetospirillum sp.]|nr:class I SAM-dependent methyltransferase [Magnetospirillum sp.]